MEVLGKFVAYIVAAAISIWLYAWAGQALWSWFAEPLGAPAIPMSHAYGLLLLVTFATTSKTVYKQGHEVHAVKTMATAIFYSPLTWAAGYIAHRIMVG